MIFFITLCIFAILSICIGVLLNKKYVYSDAFALIVGGLLILLGYVVVFILDIIFKIWYTI